MRRASRFHAYLALALLSLVIGVSSLAVVASASVRDGLPPPAAPSKVPAQDAPPADDVLSLRDRMAQAIEAYWSPGNYAVAVTDLQTGETVDVNGDRLQLSGCVINLFALIQALHDVWLVRYPLDAVDGLIAATIWSSNAQTARELYGVIGDGDVTAGVRRVEEYARAGLRLPDVILDHPPAFEDSIGISPDNWVTANAMNRALAALWDHGAIPEASWRDVLLDHMTRVKPGLNYLTAVVPEVVSHKNGFMWTSIGYVDNDVAIVRLQRGDAEYAYAFSFLSEGVEDEYADIPLGQQLAFLAYEVMSARYP